MKFLLLTFAITFGLTTQTMAASVSDEKCKPEETAACTDKSAHVTTAQSHEEGTPAKMNSLFPEKQPDPTRVARPGATELVSPSFLSNLTPGTVRLEWKSGTNVNGAAQYHVQVATDPNFKWLVVNEHFVNGKMYDFTKAEAGQRYFWRVAGVKGDNKPGYTQANFVSSAFNVK